MAEIGKSYIVRAAGTPSRPGRVFKVYPYTLRDLLEAIDDARLRSYGHGPQVVAVAEGRRRTVIRRFEDGQLTGSM